MRLYIGKGKVKDGEVITRRGIGKDSRDEERHEEAEQQESSTMEKSFKPHLYGELPGKVSEAIFSSCALSQDPGI